MSKVLVPEAVLVHEIEVERVEAEGSSGRVPRPSEERRDQLEEEERGRCTRRHRRVDGAGRRQVSWYPGHDRCQSWHCTAVFRTNAPESKRTDLHRGFFNYLQETAPSLPCAKPARGGHKREAVLLLLFRRLTSSVQTRTHYRTCSKRGNARHFKNMIHRASNWEK